MIRTETTNVFEKGREKEKRHNFLGVQELAKSRNSYHTKYFILRFLFQNGLSYWSPFNVINRKRMENAWKWKNSHFGKKTVWAYNKHLLDKAMADIKIYSVETSIIRRGRRPSWIIAWRDWINLDIRHCRVQ